MDYIGYRRIREALLREMADARGYRNLHTRLMDAEPAGLGQNIRHSLYREALNGDRAHLASLRRVYHALRESH